MADDLSDRGIGLRALAGTLAGTYSPTGEGKFPFTMMAAFAELERDLIRERTMAGLAAARAQERTGGRPKVMDANKLAAARARRANGKTPTQMAACLACHEPASIATSPTIPTVRDNPTTGWMPPHEGAASTAADHNLTNYVARSLLKAGGFKPQLHPHL